MHLPSLRRKLPPSSVVWFAVACSLALLAFAIVRGQAARAERAQRAVGPMTPLVFAAHDVAAGTVISAADVQLGEMPTIFAPPAAMTSVDDAMGLVSVSTVAEGEVLVATRLATSAFSTLMSPGNVAVTVSFASVPVGFSQADRVDAYATYAGARPFTTLVGEDLHVLGIDEPSTSVSGPTLTGVTLDVDPETARQLLQAAASSALGLAVRPAVTTTPSPDPSASPGSSLPPG
jgi:pilus assembly protein CpaB